MAENIFVMLLKFYDCVLLIVALTISFSIKIALTRR